MTAQQVLSNAASRLGFLHEEEVAILATDPATRLTLCLVRCGSGRFICPAQDVAHFLDIIERDFTASEHDGAFRDQADYVRDVSLWEPTR